MANLGFKRLETMQYVHVVYMYFLCTSTTGYYMYLSARMRMASSFMFGSARLRAPAMFRTAFRFRRP